MLRYVAQTFLLALGFCSFARADSVLINFETQTLNAPGSFQGPAQTVTISGATFSNGQLLRNETFVSGDLTGVYATANNQIFANFGPSINITFAQPISNFAVDITNNVPDDFTISDNLGDVLTLFDLTETPKAFSLPYSGIMSVSISEDASSVDYAIDNVTFDTAATPEPSSALLLLSGFLAVVVARYVRSAGQRHRA